MFSIRVTKTNSGARAIQVVSYAKRKVRVHKHLGSAHSDADLKTLHSLAREWILAESDKGSLFSENRTVQLFNPHTCTVEKSQHRYCYEFISALISRYEFSQFLPAIMHDLVVMRIIEPASKLRSIELLDRYFSIHHTRQTYYNHIPVFLATRDAIEAQAIALAKRSYAFDFSLVFYDVTTLYYESFTPDEFRKPGFSKDGKNNQPQLVIGLVVTKEGFPVSYDIFPGNTFEGHTMIPVILALMKRHNVKHATIVADAAMISDSNITALNKAKLSYIVGARLGNISNELFSTITENAKRVHGCCFRIPTDKGDLIVEYSSERYRKDKHELEKQIKKAKTHIETPSRMKRAKFVRQGANQEFILNDALIAKTRTLLGFKGYYTDIPETTPMSQIVLHYKTLWQIEKSFRMAKSDLQTRPIFSFTKYPIHAHILLCFLALILGKHLELQLGISLRLILDELMELVDVSIFDHSTSSRHVIKTAVPEVVQNWLKKLDLSY